MEPEQIQEYINIFSEDESMFSRKSQDFYDSKQLTWMHKRLNDTRSNWTERGFRPTYRNLTKMICDKSGMLYKDGMPDFSVYYDDENTPDDIATETLGEYFHDSDFLEFLINLDPMVRLLKTVGILIQYDGNEDKFSFDILHKGNAIFEKIPHSQDLSFCMHLLSADNDLYDIYRVWTPEKVEDWRKQKSPAETKPEKIFTMDNPYGMVPVSMYHDTNIPKSGSTNIIQKDLVNFNEDFNMYLIDIIWSAAWAMRKALFHNVPFEEDEIEDGQWTVNGTSKYPTQNATSITQMGPDSTVYYDSTGVEGGAKLDFLGPDIPLEEIRQLYDQLTKDIAFDWSVRIRVEGYGQVNSGFQLIVEEIPNLELRQQRQRMAERGLGRVFKLMNKMLISIKPKKIFGDDAEIYVEFAEPYLPVDPMQEDKVWLNRINNGLATKIDYFMQVQKMSRAEAEEKVKELEDAAEKRAEKFDLPVQKSENEEPPQSGSPE